MPILSEQHDIKLCPFCAEEIKVQAIRCKHCLANLQARFNLPAPRPVRIASFFVPGIAHIVLARRFIVGLATLPLCAFALFTVQCWQYEQNYEVSSVISLAMIQLAGLAAYGASVSDVVRGSEKTSRILPAVLRVGYITVAAVMIFCSVKQKVYELAYEATPQYTSASDNVDFAGMTSPQASSEPARSHAKESSGTATKHKKALVTTRARIVNQPGFYKEPNIQLVLKYQKDSESASTIETETEPDSSHVITVSSKNLSSTKIIESENPRFAILEDEYGNKFFSRRIETIFGDEQLYPGEMCTWAIHFSGRLIPTSKTLMLRLFQGQFGVENECQLKILCR